MSYTSLVPHKPVLHSGHDDFEDAKQALANMVAIMGDRRGGWIEDADGELVYCDSGISADPQAEVALNLAVTQLIGMDIQAHVTKAVVIDGAEPKGVSEEDILALRPPGPRRQQTGADHGAALCLSMPQELQVAPRAPRSRGPLGFPRALSPAAPEGLFWKEQQ